jgi:hypothetical protein
VHNPTPHRPPQARSAQLTEELTGVKRSQAAVSLKLLDLQGAHLALQEQLTAANDTLHSRDQELAAMKQQVRHGMILEGFETMGDRLHAGRTAAAGGLRWSRRLHDCLYVIPVLSIGTMFTLMHLVGPLTCRCCCCCCCCCTDAGL